MKQENSFIKALKYWLDEKKVPQTELAKALGVFPNTISQYKQGNRNPTVDKIEEIAKAFGLTLEQFFLCQDTSHFPDIEYVRKVKARPRAGSGGLETDDECEGYYSFHRSFLQRKGGTKDTMRLFSVEGDSMAPTLHSGDFAMINEQVVEITSGQIYLFRLEDELMIKRIERRPGGELLICSDNSQYENFSIRPQDEGVSFQVFGRMVWSCREY